MAGTVVCNLTLIADANSLNPTTPIAGSWTTSAGSPTLDTEVYREATGSVAEALRSSGSNNYIIFTRSSGTWDFSSTHLYIWFLSTISKFIDTKANHGIEIRVGDGTNIGYWTVGGGDTYKGGWICWVIDTSKSFDRTSGTAPNKSAITSVGINLTIVGVPRNVDNTWVDIMRYGNDGLTIYGGTSSDPAKFVDLAVEDESTSSGKAYGIIRRVAGAYIVSGPITIGDSSGTNSTYFKDTNQILLFEDLPVSSTLYALKGVGNATGTTQIYFGEKVGQAGVSGITVKSAGTPKYSLDLTNTNINNFGVYGCTFMTAREVKFPSYSTNKEVLTTTFSECAEVQASTTVFKYCKFIGVSSSENGAVLIESTSHNITYCDFINCYRAIHFTITGTLNNFDHLNFFSNTYDGYATAGTLTVNFTNCSPSPSTYDPSGYTITWQTSITLTIRHVKSGNEPTTYVQCAIFKKSDMTSLMNQEATVSDDQNPGYYKATTSYQGATGFTVIVRAREKGWIPFEVEVYLSGDLDVSAVWLPDPNYSPT